ncbi:MAG: ATP-binding protein [Myxococcales bacterium]|nr:ATP-binding protein [Myxococcales bacterium]
MKLPSAEERVAELERSVRALSEQLCTAVDGSFSFVVDADSPIEDIQQLAMLINFVTDSARRSIRRVEEQNAELKELDELKSQFLATVSHELRTPLTMIMSPVNEALRAGSLAPDIERLLRRVQRNSLRLYSLVNDVLDYSKAESGKITVNRIKLDVVASVAALISDMRPLAEARGITLRFTTPLEALITSMDAELLEKMVLNYVSNALKFTPPSGLVVVGVFEEEGACHIEVSDSGSGIPKDRQTNLFQRFYQVDGSSKRKHEGTGLGLALVKHFAEALGGSVGVRSEAGLGATFEVTLPLLEHPDVEFERSETEDSADATLGSRGWQRGAGSKTGNVLSILPEATEDRCKPRVLVADDNPDLLSYIAETLRGDFNVVTVADGLEAWKTAQRERFDVIVADVMMPELDGLELAGKLKGHASLAHVPLILVTARGGAEAIASGLESGADDYIAKPFSADELRSRVRAGHRMGELQSKLREKSRQAGMAGVASGLLHNLGNVLNSVGTSSSVIKEQVRTMRVGSLQSLADLVSAHADQLGAFVTEDSRGQQLPTFIRLIADELVAERQALTAEIGALEGKLEHVRGVVQMHRELATGGSLAELVSPSEALDAALQVAHSSLQAEGIRVKRDLQPVPAVLADKHKLLQILINLLTNAGQALGASDAAVKELSVKTIVRGEAVQMIVHDNGVGIPCEIMGRIFCQGFTTKAEGQGLGLHISALMAKELDGMLRCHSDGPGMGATFVLELPFAPALDAAS